MGANSDSGSKPRSIWATKTEADLAKAFLKVVAGQANEDELTAVMTGLQMGQTRAGFGPSRPEPTSPPSRAEAPTSSVDGTVDPSRADAPRPPGEVSLDSLPTDGVDPMTGLPPVRVETVAEAQESEEKEEGWKKTPWEAFVPALSKVPNDPLRREREMVLRYLTVNGPPERRTETAPAVSTMRFDEAMRDHGVTDEERALLLSMPQRMAQSFYTNVVCSGDGLRRFQP